MLYFKAIFLFKHFLAVLSIADWSQDLYPERWYSDAKKNIEKILTRKKNYNIAKNTILFMGDGMGISTVTAGRIYKGQLKGKNGEEEVTNMEKLDYVALSKTYGVDSQTTDSAATATAYLTGVKTRIGVTGLDGRAQIKECSHDLVKYRLDSILKWAHRAGKSVGIVTNTRVTHASPAGAYSHSTYRNYEAFDGIYFNQTHQDNGCVDIAAQLVENNTYINVIFAGGRRKFLRKIDNDYYMTNKTGDRIDNRNLIDEWHVKMKKEYKKHKFIWNITDFNDLKPNQYEHVLGLLAWDHLEDEFERVEKTPPVEPSLVEMTEKAIELLSTNPNGYFLFVEGGKIDLNHHDSKAKRALHEFVQFDEAIGKANEITSENDTLIVVTADHSHEFSIGGYSMRGNPILGVVNSVEYGLLSDSKLTHTSLNYGNGPGGLREVRKYNLTDDITQNKDYIQESSVYFKYETHGGEDVAIYSRGPMSHLFDGTVEQNYIAHAMAYASCVGPFHYTKYPSCYCSRGVKEV